MVKIKDLTQKQLLSQIEKYEKIYTQLLSEREKRVASGVDKRLMMTSAEKKAEAILQKEEIKTNESSLNLKKGNEGTQQSYHLNFDESDLSALESSAVKEEEDQEEEVRVTQLLQLSKSQLEELRGGAAKKKKKKGFFGSKK